MNNIFNKDFQDFLKVLELNDVEYILVGGYSVVIHGYSRMTGDMDIWLNRNSGNYIKIRKACLEFGLPMDELTVENFLNIEEFDVFEFGVAPVQIDLLTNVKGLVFEECIKQIKRFEINETLDINVLHINDLIMAKKAAGRPKDLDDIINLKQKDS